PDRVAAVAADRGVDGAAARPRAAAHEREIFACERARPDEAGEGGVRLLAARDDEEARGVAVESVDDPGPLRVAAGGAVRGECVRKRARARTGARVHRNPRGLVDD